MVIAVNSSLAKSSVDYNSYYWNKVILTLLFHISFLRVLRYAFVLLNDEKIPRRKWRLRTEIHRVL